MAKTLIVQYAPRMDRSATRSLALHFKSVAKGSVEVLDLAHELPPMFDEKSIAAYYKGYYNKKPLEAGEKKVFERFEKLTRQFKSADVVAVAYPMYNFSMPAAVKAYFDAILLKGETWDMGSDGYVGLMKGKKAIIITTSGGAYNKESGTEGYDFSAPFAKTLFGFMGFDRAEVVKAEGLNMMVDKKDDILQKAREKIDAIAKEYYA
ncbi:MAG: NAD(P)H-dependent oxidoreductase [Candidatus Micrarchaeia archaeon]